MSFYRENAEETLTFIWNIKNLRYSILAKAEALPSPEFCIPQFYFTTWHLNLYPKGDADVIGKHMSCYLHRGIDDGPAAIHISYSMSVPSTDIQLPDDEDYFMEGDSWGCQEFFPYDSNTNSRHSFTIILKLRYIPDRNAAVDNASSPIFSNGLKIVDELKQQMNYKLNYQAHQTTKNMFAIPTQYFCQTRLCSEKKILDFSLRDFLLNDYEIKKIIPMIFSDNFPSIIITLFKRQVDSNSQISIEMHRVKNKFDKSFLVDAQLSVFLNKTEFLSLPGEEHIFLAEKESEKWCLKETIEVFKLKENCKTCISNDVSFVFELDYVTGKIESDILSGVNFQPDGITPNITLASSEILQLYNNQELCDVVLNINGKTFEAHKVVLGAMSPVFSAMFRSGLEESKTNTVGIEDMETNVVEEMLYFMYNGTLKNLEFQSIKKLFAAADKYQIMSLMNQCRSYLMDNLTNENACQILSLADTHGDSKLKKAAIEIICIFKLDILSSDEWKILTENHCKLVNEVLTQICLKI